MERDRRFLLANAQVEQFPIIYCNDGFCDLVGFSRAELMQKPATCDFLHGPLTSSQATAQIRESLTTCLEKQLEIIYYRKDGTKFLCSQVTAPIKNEEGEISMFIMNFEDITDAPYRDEVVTPCTSPLMFFKRFPQISRQIQRMRPRLHNSIRSVEDYPNNEAGPRAARSKSLRLWLPSLLRRGSEVKDQEGMMLTPDAETVALDTFDPHMHLLELRRQSLVEMDHYTAPPPPSKEADAYKGGPPDTLWRTSSSFKEKGTLSAAVSQPDLYWCRSEPSRRRALTLDLGNAIAANNLSKSLPNASSDSDLSRVRQQRKSPSLSNVISESHSRQKENNSAKLLLKEMHSHKLYMGEKVAQFVYIQTSYLKKKTLRLDKIRKNYGSSRDMGDPDPNWSNMGHSQEYEEDKQDNYKKEVEGTKEPETDNSQQPIRKNRSEVLLAVRDEFVEPIRNRPKSEALVVKNNRVACVSIEIDPATDDDESNRNDNLNLDINKNNEVPDIGMKGPLKRQSNVKEDVAMESNGSVSTGIPSKKRMLQKQPRVEKNSPIDNKLEPALSTDKSDQSSQPLKVVRGRLAAFLSAGHKKPLKSYSCPQDDDYIPRGIKRQCMSLDNDSKPPSVTNGTENPPTIRHRPMCLKSSLKGDSVESPNLNHVNSQQTPLPSPRKPGVKLVIDDIDSASATAKERKSVVYSRKNSLMPQERFACSKLKMNNKLRLRDIEFPLEFRSHKHAGHVMG
ncbi:Potassium voltage-gated channel subfamily H like protein [Argiope bruennichi]|uniref:Potassium voltage-gated channel subfamily H like protein n=1 Tax=Argiope bruennichi TaxID=94029 RepID=A0A8T0FZ97_ARGBR|nr:Potassium voltage-gated channel subfamily H like protein [Argiope bruennichi]